MNKNALPYFCLILATLCWGGNFVLGRALHNDIPPIALNFWRWSVAVLFLLPFTGMKIWHHRKTIQQNLTIIILLSVTGVTAFHSCVYIGLHTTTAINAALMIATVPLIVPALSYIFQKTQFTLPQAAGTTVSLIGAMIFITHGELSKITTLHFVRGDLLVLTAAFLWSFYTVLLNRRPKDIPPITFLVIISTVGIILLMPFYIWEISTIGGFALSKVNVLAILYVSLFASIVAFIAWNYAVSKVGPNKSGLFIHCIPLFSTILAIIFLKEKLHMFHVGGICFVTAGIFLSSIKRHRSKSL